MTEIAKRKAGRPGLPLHTRAVLCTTVHAERKRAFKIACDKNNSAMSLVLSDLIKSYIHKNLSGEELKALGLKVS